MNSIQSGLTHPLVAGAWNAQPDCTAAAQADCRYVPDAARRVAARANRRSTLVRRHGRSLRIGLFAALLLSAATACVVSPVTGERQLQFYGSSWENQVGSTMYAPMRQSQGGDFNVDPELTRYVQDVGQRLAAQSRRKDELHYEFNVINSSVPNAWSLPGGKIVINRGLLAQLDSEAELAAVLGHEVIHADAAHGAQQQSKGMLAQVGAVASMVVLQSTVDNPAARELTMMMPATALQLVMQKYGRDAERESDEYGMRYMSEAGYDPQGAVALQETFVALSAERRSDWLSGLFASHPPSLERLKNNRATAARLPAGGEWGKAEYQRATAYLRQVQPAYEAYDEATQAVNDNRLDKAQKLLTRALSIEPRESLFHSLQGDVHVLRKRPKDAMKSFDRAVRANGGFFYPYLRRGQTAYAMGSRTAARADLSRSLELLPTADAHYLMGLLERDAGNGSVAMKHFQAAGQGASAVGAQARREQVRMDIGQNPAQYIATQAALDRSGVVWMQLANRTDIALRRIEISYTWLDQNGQTVSGREVYAGPLAAQQQDRLRLKAKFANVQELQSRFRATVSAAQIAE